MTTCRLIRFAAVLHALSVAALAHPILQLPMWVQFEPRQIRVGVDVSLRELEIAQGVALKDTPDVAGPSYQAAQRSHGDYVLSHLHILIGGHALTGRITQIVPPASVGTPEATFLRYDLTYPISGPMPAEVTLYETMLEEWPYQAGTSWNVSYVVRTKMLGSNEVTTWLLGYRETCSIPTGAGEAVRAEDRPESHPFWDYLWLGVMHILTGYDHLLFVSCLVLGATGLWELVKVVAAFTLAHTLTLVLCVLGLVSITPRIVEPLIALSIVAVAVENVLRPDRIQSHTRCAVAFGFGLVHGLGFAGGLLNSMQELPAQGLWLALGAFSTGVELGHQAVVLPLFFTLRAVKNPLGGRYQALRRGLSAAIAGGGLYYFASALTQSFV